MEASKHEPEIPRHPARHKGCDLLLESRQIIAAVADILREKAASAFGRHSHTVMG
jgi:zona occludens toxin (predicted ATPase)